MLIKIQINASLKIFSNIVIFEIYYHHVRHIKSFIYFNIVNSFNKP